MPFPLGVGQSLDDVGGVTVGHHPPWVFARPVYATLDAGLLTPLTRVRYHFDNPDSTVHTATAVEGTAGLGLGMYFW